MWYFLCSTVVVHSSCTAQFKENVMAQKRKGFFYTAPDFQLDLFTPVNLEIKKQPEWSSPTHTAPAVTHSFQ